MDLRNYFIYYIIEDSVKEGLYGPVVLLNLFYNRRFCQRDPTWTRGTTSSILKSKILSKRSCMDLRNYLIYDIIEDSVKEVLYGPEVLLHLLHHRRVC